MVSTFSVSYNINLVISISKHRSVIMSCNNRLLLSGLDSMHAIIIKLIIIYQNARLPFHYIVISYIIYRSTTRKHN
jgi:hypothetical protein